MTDHPHTGVHVEEVSSGARPIGRISTGTVGFVGHARHAPDGRVPPEITGLAEFERLFGGPGPLDADGGRIFALHESARLFFLNGGSRCRIVAAGGFTDEGGAIIRPTSRSLRRGVVRLRRAPDVAVIAVPDAALLAQAKDWRRVARLALACARRDGRFVILDVHRGDRATGGADDPIDGPRGIRAMIDGRERGWGAAYWPWLRPVDGAPPVPPCGAVAGAYAAVDARLGVWKAPANVALAGIAGLTAKFASGRQDGLNAPADGKAVNAIRALPGRGLTVWGARTLDASDSEYRYVPVRRTMLMIEGSLMRGLEFVGFEPNGPETWKAARSGAELFLDGLWRDGALAGNRPQEAYSARCGLGETMSAADVAAGRIVVEIAVAPLRPAEFLVLRVVKRAAA